MRPPGACCAHLRQWTSIELVTHSRWAAAAVSAGVSKSHTLTGCALEPSVSYVLMVRAFASGAGPVPLTCAHSQALLTSGPPGEGTLAAMPFAAPSNDFRSPPSLRGQITTLGLVHPLRLSREQGRFGLRRALARMRRRCVCGLLWPVGFGAQCTPAR